MVEDGRFITQSRSEFNPNEMLDYMNRLLPQLGRIAARPLPPVAISGILGHFGNNWSYQSISPTEAEDRQGFSLLQRVIRPSVRLYLPVPENPARQKVWRDDTAVNIKVAEVIGGDLVYAVGLERQLLARRLGR
jgi:hypothetical protein